PSLARRAGIVNEETAALNYNHRLDIHRHRRHCARVPFAASVGKFFVLDLLRPASRHCLRSVLAVWLRLGALAFAPLARIPHPPQYLSLTICGGRAWFAIRRNRLFPFSPAGLEIFSRHETKAATASRY